MIITVIVFIFAVCMPFSVLFHVLRMYREKSSKGQSITSPFILSIGSIFWGLHGWMIGDPLLILANILWVVCNLIYIGTILIYK